MQPNIQKSATSSNWSSAKDLPKISIAKPKLNEEQKTKNPSQEAKVVKIDVEVKFERRQKSFSGFSRRQFSLAKIKTNDDEPKFGLGPWEEISDISDTDEA